MNILELYLGRKEEGLSFESDLEALNSAERASDIEGLTGPAERESDLLVRLSSSCPAANVVMDSQRWSRIAAIQQGNCTIFSPDEVAGELPFDPTKVAVQITYYWDLDACQWDLAWVATWPYED